uniref:Integrase catalytic domain-containing protein n=1 Tax=Fagus sylvatica TaxID=28930 RepID=A0A2N9F119_FAGSY
MRGGRVGFIENRARLAQHHHARRMTVLRELWYCHVAVLSFHASSPSNPPRFPCAYPFLSDFRGQFWRSSGTQNGSCGISSESSRRPLSNDIKFARIGVRTRELWLPEVGVSELFSCTLPVKIPVKRGMLSANREFHDVAGVIIFPTHPGSRINLLRAGKTLRAKAAVREKKCVLLPARFFSNLVPVPDSRESELGLVRYGPASRVHRGVFGPFEGSFPIRIPADPDKFLAIREFHVVHGCVLFPMCPGSQINLLRVRKTLCASVATSVGKFRKFQHSLISSACFHARGRRSSRCRISTILVSSESLRYLLFNGTGLAQRRALGSQDMILRTGGRRNVPYAKGGGQFDPVFGLVNGPVKPWSNLVNLGQTWSPKLWEMYPGLHFKGFWARWDPSRVGNGSVKPRSNLVKLRSNLVNPSQTWSNLGKCVSDLLLGIWGYFMEDDTDEWRDVDFTEFFQFPCLIVPPGFVTSEFEIFYEDGDPEVHLQKYGEKMALHLENELLMISVFPESLSKQAAAWFYQLRNLTGWDDLVRVFLERYRFNPHSILEYLGLKKDEEPYIIPDPGVSKAIVEIKEESDMSSLPALAEGEEEEKDKPPPPAKEPSNITTTAEEEYAGPMVEGLSIHTITGGGGFHHHTTDPPLPTGRRSQDVDLRTIATACLKITRKTSNDPHVSKIDNKTDCSLDNIDNSDEEIELPSDILEALERQDEGSKPNIEELEIVNLANEGEEPREVKIGTRCAAEQKEALIALLREFHENLRLQRMSVFSFMDGFSGYNQIKMAEEDKSKTAFVTHWGTFVYDVMPFGLKNARSHLSASHATEEVSAQIKPEQVCLWRHIRKVIRLHRQRQRELRLILQKVQAIRSMPAPRTEKEIRSFLGRINYIARFIAQLTATCEPLFKLLRKDVKIKWTEDCQRAFDKIKEYLLRPILVLKTARKPPLTRSRSICSTHPSWFRQLQVVPSFYTSQSKKHPWAACWDNKTRLGRKEQAIYYLSKKFTEPGEPATYGSFTLTEQRTLSEAAIGAVLVSPKGQQTPIAVKLGFDCTNNMTEYEACIVGLQAALEFGAYELEVFGDSLLIVSQTNGEWQARDPKLIPYQRYISRLVPKFKYITFTYTPRAHNHFADALATLASLIKLVEGDDVRPLRIETRDIPAYCVCVEECMNVEAEIDEQALIMRAGYYWLTMERDCIRHVQTCHKCQMYQNSKNAPPQYLHTMASPWPFSAWGMDVIGAITPKASNGHEFILVAIDYFTKWVEACSFKNVTQVAVTRFVKNNIICRYGMPEMLITDNASNLNNRMMDQLCQQFKIQHHNSAPYRPKMNGAVEAANKNVKKILSKMTGDIIKIGTSTCLMLCVPTERQ